MPSIQFSAIIAGLGGNIQANYTRSADGGTSREVTVPKGYAGTLSTRTDNETGTLTLGAGHGITTGMIIDLYWTGGFRRDITVGTVSGTSVPIGANNSGAGSNLPTHSTAIIASQRVRMEADFRSDLMSLVAWQMCYGVTETARSSVRAYDSDDSGLGSFPTLEPNVPLCYDLTADPALSPFEAGVVSYLHVSNRSTSADGTFKFLLLEDSTP